MSRTHRPHKSRPRPRPGHSLFHDHPEPYERPGPGAYRYRSVNPLNPDAEPTEQSFDLAEPQEPFSELVVELLVGIFPTTNPTNEEPDEPERTTEGREPAAEGVRR
jgi:hypothetical protein